MGKYGISFGGPGNSVFFNTNWYGSNAGCKVFLFSRIDGRKGKTKMCGSILHAVCMATGGNLKGKRLEGGVLSGLTKGGHKVEMWISERGKKLTTDGWIPFLELAKRSRQKKAENTAKALARLDSLPHVE